MTEPRIREDADWPAAGRTLVSNLSALSSPSERLTLLHQVCADFGEQLYPAFLKLLCAIGRFGDEPSRKITAATLATALERARLPSGRLSAWGLNNSAGRTFGPVEYLCVWYLDATRSDPLDEATFVQAGQFIMNVLRADAHALSLYGEKLSQDANDPLEGTYSRSARQLIKTFADAMAGAADDETLASNIRLTLRNLQAEASRGRWGI